MFLPFQVKALAINLPSLDLFLTVQHPSFNRTEYILTWYEQPGEANRALKFGKIWSNPLE